MKYVACGIFIAVMLMGAISVFADDAGENLPKHDPLYYKKIKDIDILAVMEYEGLKIAVFRDRLTGIMHPLKVGNELTHGKIISIDKSSVRVDREGQPDCRFSVYQRILPKQTAEFISFSGENLDIRGIIANLSEPAQKPVYVNKNINIKLSITVKFLHWRDVLDLLAQTFALEVIEDEKDIKVSQMKIHRQPEPENR